MLLLLHVVLCALQGKLFPALRKVKLIPEDVEISALDYSRCGRTDKGVSALGQVLLGALADTVLASAEPNVLCVMVRSCL